MPGKVLVIDDEASIRLACEKVLTAAGYEVEVAADGAEGLDRLAAGGFDVALVDLKMPGVDGMEVLRRAREMDPDLVTIVITGYPSYESVVEAIKAGAYDYIPKPFSPDELRTVVGRGYEKHELERQARLLSEERARNLATIAEERGRLLTVINSMADGVMVTDREGRLVLYNPAAARWLAPGALGRPLGEVCRWTELEGLVREVIATGGLRSLSTDLVCEKGAPTFMVTVAPVLGDAGPAAAAAGPGPGGAGPGPGSGGEVLGAVLVLRDVTELRLKERERANFMAMVCHEIRAPLSAIAGTSNSCCRVWWGRKPGRSCWSAAGLARRDWWPSSATCSTWPAWRPRCVRWSASPSGRWWRRAWPHSLPRPSGPGWSCAWRPRTRRSW